MPITFLLFPAFSRGHFSREPAYNDAVRATIYDKTKKETPFGISFFVVRSTGIEAVDKSHKPLENKGFQRFVRDNDPKFQTQKIQNYFE